MVGPTKCTVKHDRYHRLGCGNEFFFFLNSQSVNWVATQSVEPNNNVSPCSLVRAVSSRDTSRTQPITRYLSVQSDGRGSSLDKHSPETIGSRSSEVRSIVPDESVRGFLPEAFSPLAKPRRGFELRGRRGHLNCGQRNIDKNKRIL